MQSLINHITQALSAINVEDKYREMLDEEYSFEKIGGPFNWLNPSDVLFEMDRTAYNCGLSDFPDEQDWCEINGDYYDFLGVETERENFIDNLTHQIEDLEKEQGEDLCYADEIKDLQTQLEQAETYQF